MSASKASTTEIKQNNLLYYLNITITVLIMFGFRFIPAPEPVAGLFLKMA